MRNNFSFMLVRSTAAAVIYLALFFTYGLWKWIEVRSGWKEATIIVVAVYFAIWFFLVGQGVH